MDIHLILGPMFSEKSTTLFRKINQFKVIDKKVLVINHQSDTRCGDEIKTHDDSRTNATKVHKLMNIDDNLILEADVIAIDEGQFFSDIQEFILKWEHTVKIMYICGLDGGYKRQKLGHLLDIIPLCNSVIKLNALCTECKNGNKAPFTYRNNKSNETVLIGDKNTYSSLCREHYIFMQQER